MKHPLEYTQAALAASKNKTERMMNATHSIIKKSKKLRHPSKQVDKIGTAVSAIVSLCLIIYGVIQFLSEKPLWSLITLSVGSISFVSNRIHQHKVNHSNQK